MADGTWSVAEAKSKFSEVVEKARSDGPQHLTKNGREAAVIVSAAEYRRLVRLEEGRQRPSLDPLADPTVRLLSRKELETLFARDDDPGRAIEF